MKGGFALDEQPRHARDADWRCELVKLKSREF